MYITASHQFEEQLCGSTVSGCYASLWCSGLLSACGAFMNTSCCSCCCWFDATLKHETSFSRVFMLSYAIRQEHTVPQCGLFRSIPFHSIPFHSCCLTGLTLRSTVC